MEANGQVIIITGGGSGIGRETALKMAKEGYTLVLGDFNIESADKVAKEVEALEGKVATYKLDVSKEKEVKGLVDFAVEKFGTLNGIFNNAGIGLVKPLLEMDPETYHKVIDVDQHSVYYGIYYTARKMVDLGTKGTIVNTASIYGSIASKGSFNYNAAKAAVVMMSKSGALELAEHGIRVVGVAPGFINTPILGEDKETKEFLASQHMHNELIEPEKVADVVTFLFSDKASAINGSTVAVDDGFLSFKI